MVKLDIMSHNYPELWLLATVLNLPQKRLISRWPFNFITKYVMLNTKNMLSSLVLQAITLNWLDKSQKKYMRKPQKRDNRNNKIRGNLEINTNN
jgi:hypothetical protein